MTQGKVGVTYPFNVQCSTTDSSALPLPALHGARAELRCVIVFSLSHSRCAPSGNITMGLCPPGTQATVDMRFCEPCKGDDFNLAAGGVCRPCPMGAKCTAGNRLEALPDWWCVPVREACHPPTQALTVLRQARIKHLCHLVLVPDALVLPVWTQRRRPCLRSRVRLAFPVCH